MTATGAWGEVWVGGWVSCNEGGGEERAKPPHKVVANSHPALKVIIKSYDKVGHKTPRRLQLPGWVTPLRA